MLTLFTLSPLVNLSAQQRTYSPLSRFGLGETQTIGYSGYSAMGRTGIGMRSVSGINNTNIASLTALDSLSFYFDGGMSYYWQSQDTDQGSIDNSDMVFDYIALAFSVSPKVTSTFGFKPMSGRGYNYLTRKTLKDGSESISELSGSGNITNAYLGIAVNLVENLSVGANVGYMFGNLRNISKASFTDVANALMAGELNKIRISSVVYDFGAQYTYSLDEERSLTLGLTYRPKIVLKGDTTVYQGLGTRFVGDNDLFGPYEVNVLKDESNNFSDGEIEYAASFGLGVSYNIKNKLTLGADYVTEKWADANYYDSSFEYKDASSYSVGAEFIPNDRSAKSYLARVRYRGGLYYREENMRIENSNLFNYGITFGLGLPLKRSKTSINLGFEVGTRDSNNNSDFKQTYGKLTANFSLHELWFYKRKFD